LPLYHCLLINAYAPLLKDAAFLYMRKTPVLRIRALADTLGLARSRDWAIAVFEYAPTKTLMIVGTDVAAVRVWDHASPFPKAGLLVHSALVGTFHAGGHIRLRVIASGVATRQNEQSA
jgi:hypothetical protein